jgi:transposase
MAKERLPMRKILEILRLRWVLGLTVRETSESLRVSTGAVSRITERAVAAALDYEAAQALSPAELEARLYPSSASASRYVEPDIAWIDRELRRVGVTLELLHQEYLAEHGDRALCYSAFCRRYQVWKKRRGPVLRRVYRGGEVLFVDFSGKRPGIVDAANGEVTPVELFVAVMGASNFTYVEAVRTQRVPDWIGAHTRALEYLGGVPRTVVPDQLKAAVTKSHRYEPVLQRTYEDLGRHYGMAVVPARPRKPRDKAKVEAGVLVAQRWILARLRDETFFSLEALNVRLRELLEDLNDRPMKALGGVSRRGLFVRVDRPELRELPTSHFEPAEWRTARVHEDYHIDIQRHWYSVPFELVGQEVDVRLTETTVEVYREGHRVAVHTRCDDEPYQPSTDPRHRPPNHRAVFDGTRDKLAAWAREVGPHTEALMTRLLDPAHNFAGQTRRRSGYGLRRLEEKYQRERIEEACRRVLAFERVSYKRVERLLRLNLDQVEESAPTPTTPIEHDQVRGASYFFGPDDMDDGEETENAA